MTTPTLSQYPMMIGEVLARAARREARRARFRRFFVLQKLRVHTARISPNETVESNLPLR